uniref:Uncharacterized protein n=1 Tax=Hyaloperonospora arabidopsidis (strain Emoy2) TaxID=559515 RepID=M4BP95_HYAAE
MDPIHVLDNTATGFSASISGEASICSTIEVEEVDKENEEDATVAEDVKLQADAGNAISMKMWS